MRAWGSLRNLGRPVVSILENPVWGTGGTKAPGLSVRAFLCRWEQKPEARGVVLPGGEEARWDRRQGLGASP
jgi:hypothetical protein